MATKDTVVQELVVNTLTQAQFKAAQEAGTLSPYELYGTPDTSVRLPVLTPMWFDHLANDVSWLRADTFSWQSGDVYIAAYEHLTEDLESANRLFLAWVSGTDIVYTLDENAGSDVYKQSTSGYMAKQSHHIATGSSVEDERTGDVYTRDSSKDIESKALYTDSINGNEIGYYLASDGHKICTTDQESNISALYESTGVAWYYILDTENKQFKLPRSKHNKYADTVPVVGTGKSIGFTPVNKAFSGNNALYPNSGAIGTTRTVYQANTAAGLGLSTDQNQSQVFAQQTQDTDQYKYLYFYVGNFEQDSVEQTAGITTETLNNKLDIGAGNATDETKTTIVGWGTPDYTSGVTVANKTEFIAPSAGALYLYGSTYNDQTLDKITINGITLNFGQANANTININTSFFFVDKGDVVLISFVRTQSSATFFPLKGVN